MLTGLWTIGIKVPDIEKELQFQKSIGNEIILDEKLELNKKFFRVPLVKMGDQCCPGKVTPTDGKSLPLNILWPVLPGNDLKSRGRKWPPERSIPTRHNGG